MKPHYPVSNKAFGPFASFFKFKFEGPYPCKSFSAYVSFLAHFWVDIVPFDFYHRESLFTIFLIVEEAC